MLWNDIGDENDIMRKDETLMGERTRTTGSLGTRPTVKVRDDCLQSRLGGGPAFKG